MPRLLLVSLAVFALIAVACNKAGGGAASSANFDSGPLVVAKATPEISKLEQQMHARLNRDRQKQGLKPLAFDTRLADIARGHSKDMHERGFFAHDSPFTGSLQDRLDRAGYLSSLARENIGEGASVDKTQDALLASPGHHENIMAADVSQVGIGIFPVGTGPTQRLLVTQVFAAPVTNQDPAAARSALLSRINQARKAGGQRPLPSHALLEKLAKKHVGDVTDGQDSAVSSRIGDAVTSQLQNSGLGGVIVGTSVFLSPESYEPSGAVVSREARGIGLATAPGRDARGRPAIKALVLIGL